MVKAQANPKKNIWIPLAIFIVALIINLIGVKYGFPLLTHNDEPAIIDPVVRMTEYRSFKNDNLNRPDQITIQFYNLYLNAVSWIKYGKNMAQVHEENPLFIYLHARIIICILGALVPVLAWKIGNRMKGYGLGAFFAFLCILYPSYIFNSRFIAPDIPLTLFTFIAIYNSIKFLQTNQLKFLAIAAFMSALCVMEKYSGLLTASVVIISLLLRLAQDKDKPLAERWKHFFFDGLKMFGVFLLGILIFGVSLYTNVQGVIYGLRYEMVTAIPGADGLTYFGKLAYYAKEFVKQTNFLILTMVFVGLFAAVKQKEKHSYVFLLSIVYWLSLSTILVHFERWSLPMMIAPLFFSAYGLDYCYEKVRTDKIAKALYLSLLVIGLGLYAISGLAEAVKWAWPDTRGIALDYFNEVGIKEEESIYEGYTPFKPLRTQGFHDYDQATLFDGKKYIITADYMHIRFYNEAERYADIIAYHESVLEKGTLIKEFVPDRSYNTPIEQLRKIWQYTKWALSGFGDTQVTVGPIIKVYKINQ